MKLTDAQTAALQRGAQHLNGFISPAPKTPEHMARLQAQKLAAMGLVQEAACAFAEPAYFRDDESGETLGYRVTAAGFTALGIDASEWPAYAQQDPDAPVDPQDAALQGEVLPPAGGPDMPAAWQAPAEDDATLDANEHGQLAADYQAEQAGELAAGEDASYLPIEDALIAAIRTVTATVPDTRAWTRFCRDHADLVAALREAVKPTKAPKAAKPAGEPGVPREGSKLALVIGMLQRPGGAMAAEVEAATSWNNTSTRGFISALKIKRGLAVDSRKEDGSTRYWIGADNAPEPLPAAAPKAAKAGEPVF